MHETDPSRYRLRRSMTSNIAWLSVCVLAAAWGHLLDTQWQVIWAVAGAFGLTAAVGLASLEVASAAHERRFRESAVRVRLEGGLARLHDHSATLDSIHAAVRQLAESAVKQRHGQQPKSGQTKRWQSLLLGQYPFELTPIEEHHDTLECAQVPPILGALRQISSRAISFEHSLAFSSRLVMLTFDLDDQHELSFVVDVMWTQRSGESFASTGTILAVGVPEAQQVEAVA